MAALAEPAAEHTLLARAAGHVDQLQLGPGPAVAAGIRFDLGAEPVGRSGIRAA